MNSFPGSLPGYGARREPLAAIDFLGLEMDRDTVDELDGLTDKELIQSVLRGDFELIRSYGEEHPETWVGAWWDNEPAVRMVAAFTGDVTEHDAALRPRLGHPDRLLVESRPHSLSTLRRIREEIERTFKERAAQTGRQILISVGEGAGVIRVSLLADQEDVAREIAARYGDAVKLRVGAFRFPDRRRGRPRPPVRPELEEQVIEGLEMSVEVGQTVLKSGRDGDGLLVLRNNSSEKIGPLISGRPLVGSLVNDALEVVGGYAGMIAGVGQIIDLAPGKSVSIPVLFGTASFREDLGYVVPPGTYWLKVQMRVQHGHGSPAHALTAPLTQITVIPREPAPR